jgi:hypothetical protein
MAEGLRPSSETEMPGMKGLCRASCLRFRNSEDRRLSYGAASLHVGRERVRDHHASEYGILDEEGKVAKVIFCRGGRIHA